MTDWLSFYLEVCDHSGKALPARDQVPPAEAGTYSTRAVVTVKVALLYQAQGFALCISPQRGWARRRGGQGDSRAQVRDYGEVWMVHLCVESR